MTEQSSPTSQTPSAFYDPESWSWRTSQGCLLSAVPESLERLPDWGTTSDGALYEQQTPERLTAARDGSASPALPTPTVNDSHNSNPPPSQFNRNSLALPALMALLPIPQAMDCKNFGPNMDWKKRAESHADSVASVLMNLLLNDGSDSSDDPHLTQLMIEGCDPDSSNG